jgi:hypothetical protein
MHQRASRKKVFVLICIILTLASLACQPKKTGSSSDSDENTNQKDSSKVKEELQQKELTAQEILDKSTEAMKNVKTMSLQLIVTSGSAGISIEINGEGVIEQPDKAYLKMDYAGQTIEVLTLSKTEAYIKQSGSTTWEPIAVEQLSQPGGMNVDVPQQLGIAGFADDIYLAGSETIEGVDCYHLTFGVDMTKYLAQLGEAGAQIDANTSEGAGEFWIDKEDFLMRKFLFNLDVAVQGVTVNASTQITMSKYNEPVKIPSP